MQKIFLNYLEVLKHLQQYNHCLNDELVSFNKNLENQAKAQDVAAKAAFQAQNTIQGQLQRLSAAFTNLTTEGSEFGIAISTKK